MLLKKNMYNKFAVFLLFVFVLISLNQLHAIDNLYASIGYSPGITDHRLLNPDPDTHTYKYIIFGLDLNSMYLFNNRIGIGSDIHWGVIYNMTIKNNSSEIVTRDWDGTVSQFNFSTYFLYTPLRNKKMILILGLGPSYTLNSYTSKYGNDIDAEHYLGIALNIHYIYFIKESFCINAGFRSAIELIGFWDSELITSVFQIQYYPFFGMGIRF